MSVLRIQVLGRGMIPRDMGLAPRKEPFPADVNLISLILQTRGLTVNYLNPETKKFAPLTTKNFKTIWDKYADYDLRNVPIPKKNIEEGAIAGEERARALEPEPKPPVYQEGKPMNLEPAYPTDEDGNIIEPSTTAAAPVNTTTVPDTNNSLKPMLNDQNKNNQNNKNNKNKR